MGFHFHFIAAVMDESEIIQNVLEPGFVRLADSSRILEGGTK
jgi:hypothetical protein